MYIIYMFFFWPTRCSFGWSKRHLPERKTCLLYKVLYIFSSEVGKHFSRYMYKKIYVQYSILPSSLLLLSVILVCHLMIFYTQVLVAEHRVLVFPEDCALQNGAAQLYKDLPPGAWGETLQSVWKRLLGVLLWSVVNKSWFLWKKTCQIKNEKYEKWKTCWKLFELIVWKDGVRRQDLVDIWFIRHRLVGCTYSHDQGRWAFFRSTSSKSAKFCIIILFWTSPGHVTYGFSGGSFAPMTCSKKAGFWVWKNLGVLPPKRPADGSGVFQSLKDEPQVSRCVYSAHMPGTYFLRLVVVTKG